MKPINHPKLGGDVVDRNPHRFPQRKPEKAMNGEELLNKAVFGTPKPETEEQRRAKEWQTALKK